VLVWWPVSVFLEWFGSVGGHVLIVGIWRQRMQTRGLRKPNALIMTNVFHNTIDCGSACIIWDDTSSQIETRSQS
jgi:hypothetical protein